MPKLRVVALRVLLGIAALLALDIALSFSLLRAGKLGKRPLPPFGIDLDAQQIAVLDRLESGEPGTAQITGFDRELGWCVRPNSATPKGDFHINARGVRGTRDYTREPSNDRLRLACFGDSFTFCDEVPDEFTWEALLEKSTPTVEALNFGVPAYGTDQALLRMRREGIDGARVVVLGLLLENIGRNVNRYRPLWTPRTLAPLAKPRFVLVDDQLELVPQPFANAQELARAARDGSILDTLAAHEFWRGRPRLWTGRSSSLLRMAAGWRAYAERDPRRLWLDEAGEARQVTLALVESFRTEALAAGARDFVVLLLPMREELDALAANGSHYWKDLPAQLAQRGIESLDLAPALVSEQLRCESDPAHPTVFVAAHLSSVGNHVVAVALRDWLAQRGQLPAPAHAR